MSFKPATRHNARGDKISEAAILRSARRPNQTSRDSEIACQMNIDNLKRFVRLEDESDNAIMAMPKLRISDVSDPAELEANMLAEQIMAMNSSDVSTPAQVARQKEVNQDLSLTRDNVKVSEPDLVSRQASLELRGESANTKIDNGISSVLSTGGIRLDSNVSNFMEPRFGYNFSDVRIHTDDNAARSAESINALAYTVGNDIVFGQGQYQPNSIEGKRLIAHELTHVVQQGAARKFNSFVARSMNYNLHTDQNQFPSAHVDYQIPVTPSPTNTVHRFGSPEHELLGSEGSGYQTLDIDLGDGTMMTYGEMVALAGDYFGNLKEITDLAKTEDGRARLRYTKWLALKVGSEPDVTDDVKKKVLNRYYELAAENFSHFSGGGTARNAYEERHKKALGYAFYSGTPGQEYKWSIAMNNEAFSNHFLTDMFAGGHVRTPRIDIKAWYKENYPNSVPQFITYMATVIARRLNEMGDVPWLWPVDKVASKLRVNIEDLGGKALPNYSLGDIVSLGYHDQDNKGLGVISDADPTGRLITGGFHWATVGDSHLAESDITKQMAEAAIGASLLDLVRAKEAGAKATAGVCLPKELLKSSSEDAISSLEPFAAESFIPREDPQGSNVQMDWRWGHLDDVLAGSIDNAVKGDIAGTLREKASGVKEIMSYTIFGDPHPYGRVKLHVRSAFLYFCDYLAKYGLDAIVDAMQSPATLPQNASMNVSQGESQVRSEDEVSVPAE